VLGKFQIFLTLFLHVMPKLTNLAFDRCHSSLP